MNNTTNWHHTIIPGARCIIPWFSYVWYMCVFFALNCCSFYSSTSSTPSVHADSFILGRYKICGNNTTTQAAMLYQVDSSSSTMPCRCAGLRHAQHTYASYPDTLTEKRTTRITQKKRCKTAASKCRNRENSTPNTQHPAPRTQYRATEIQITSVPGYANSGTKINYKS